MHFNDGIKQPSSHLVLFFRTDSVQTSYLHSRPTFQGVQLGLNCLIASKAPMNSIGWLRYFRAGYTEIYYDSDPNGVTRFSGR